jgi:hypothetical protein
VDVEHVGFDAEDLGALGDLGLPPLGQRSAGLLEVSDVAVGHRHELHFVARRRPHRGDAARFELGIVRMGAEGDDPQRLLRLHGRRRPGRATRHEQRRDTRQHATGSLHPRLLLQGIVTYG